MDMLQDLIKKNEKYLFTRVKTLALERGYVIDTPSLDQNLQAFTLVLSSALLDGLVKSWKAKDVSVNNDYILKLTSISLMFRLSNNIEMTADLSTFMGIIKCCRLSYIEQVFMGNFEFSYEKKYTFFIERFFDIVELNFCSEWPKVDYDDVKFRTLAEITPASIIMHAGDKFIYANPSTADITGYTKEELYQKFFWEIIHEDFQDLVKARWQQREKGNTPPSRYEIKIITKQGEEQWIDLSVGNIFLNGLQVAMGVAFNITKRKKIEAALIESEERYRKLVELSPDAIFIRVEEQLIFANTAGAKLLGLKYPEDTYGKSIQDFLSLRSGTSSILYELPQELGSEVFFPIREQHFRRKKDGAHIHIETAAALFPFKGQDALLIVARDVSELKKSKELEKKVEEKTKQLNDAMQYDKLKTEFLANISHELKTPLNVILGTLQMLEFLQKNQMLFDNTDKIKRYTYSMKQNCFRLLRLVNNLIDITKIDSGYLKLHLQNGNIVNIIEEITLSVAEYIENKGITLIFDTDTEEKIIAFDADKIERILLNLLSNAIKFTKAGGCITVNVFDLGKGVQIRVRDTGIGIPKDKQQVIFDRFVQVDRSLSRNHEGSGIGLSLVKSLVEMHNGKISLKSSCGEGSEFIIDLPSKTVPEETQAANIHLHESNIEKIDIEFSDIYA